MFASGYQRLPYLAAALLWSSVISACHDMSEQGPRPLSKTPTEIDDDSDQPIRLSYVCGNRFVLGQLLFCSAERDLAGTANG